MSFLDLKHLLKKKLMNATIANSTDGNFSHREKMLALERETFPKLDWELLVYFIAFVGVLVVVLNSYIIVLFLRFKTLRTKRNIFPFNLTISDAVVGFFVIPLFILTEELAKSITLSSYISRHRLHHQSGILLNFNSLVSIYSLAAVIVDRAVAVCLPLKYHRNFTARKAVIATTLIWILSAIFSCISFIVFKPLYDADKISEELEALTLLLSLKEHFDKYSYYRHTFYGLCITATVASGFSLLIQSIVVSRTLRRKQKRAAAIYHEKRPEELKAAYMLGIMFLAVLFWISSIVYLQTSKLSKEWYMGMYLGRFFLSTVNPVLYTLLKHDIRSKVDDDARMIKGAIQRCFLCRCFTTKQRVSNSIVLQSLP